MVRKSKPATKAKPRARPAPARKPEVVVLSDADAADDDGISECEQEDSEPTPVKPAAKKAPGDDVAQGVSSAECTGGYWYMASWSSSSS